MTKAMETMGGYLVLAFFAAQFVALFGWTNLGLIVAVNGAEALRSLGLQDQKVLLARRHRPSMRETVRAGGDASRRRAARSGRRGRRGAAHRDVAGQSNRWAASRNTRRAPSMSNGRSRRVCESHSLRGAAKKSPP